MAGNVREKSENADAKNEKKVQDSLVFSIQKIEQTSINFTGQQKNQEYKPRGMKPIWKRNKKKG